MFLWNGTAVVPIGAVIFLHIAVGAIGWLQAAVVKAVADRNDGKNRFGKAQLPFWNSATALLEQLKVEKAYSLLIVSVKSLYLFDILLSK